MGPAEELIVCMRESRRTASHKTKTRKTHTKQRNRIRRHSRRGEKTLRRKHTNLYTNEHTHARTKYMKHYSEMPTPAKAMDKMCTNVVENSAHKYAQSMDDGKQIIIIIWHKSIFGYVSYIILYISAIAAAGQNALAAAASWRGSPRLETHIQVQYPALESH